MGQSNNSYILLAVDWLISVFNQRTKSRTLLNNNNIPYDPWNSSIIDFITDVLNGNPIPLGCTQNFGVTYTLPLLERIKEESGIDKIAVLNFHDASVVQQREYFAIHY